MEKKIKEIIKREEIDIEQNLDMEKLYYILEQEGLIDFSVYGRENSGGNDFWFQAEYYDKDLGYTIVVDYDYNMWQENVSDIVSDIEHTNKKIEEIKGRIIKNNK